MVGGGVAAVYFLSIQSKRFVALMNEIVASIMILFSTKFKLRMPELEKNRIARKSSPRGRQACLWIWNLCYC